MSMRDEMIVVSRHSYLAHLVYIINHTPNTYKQSCRNNNILYRLHAVAGTGLRINSTKTKMMRIKNESENGVSVMSGPIEEVSEFTYIGSVVSKTGGTEEAVKLKLGRARVAFRMMDKVWTSNVYSRRTIEIIQLECETMARKLGDLRRQ